MFARWRERSRVRWTGTVQGRQVELVASPQEKALYVDRVQVARKTTLSGCGATLTWTLDVAGGPPLVLTATVGYPTPKGAVGHIYADGAWIAGEPGGALPPVVGALRPEPTDARWAAARVLLVDLRAANDPGRQEAVGRLEVSLREVLDRLSRLTSAGAAHVALGGDPTSVEAARVPLDATADALLDALRKLHLLALGDGAPTGRIEELLARASAEAEVDSAAVRASRRQRAD